MRLLSRSKSSDLATAPQHVSAHLQAAQHAQHALERQRLAGQRPARSNAGVWLTTRAPAAQLPTWQVLAQQNVGSLSGIEPRYAVTSPFELPATQYSSGLRYDSEQQLHGGSLQLPYGHGHVSVGGGPQMTISDRASLISSYGQRL